MPWGSLKRASSRGPSTQPRVPSPIARRTVLRSDSSCTRRWWPVSLTMNEPSGSPTTLPGKRSSPSGRGRGT